MQTKHFMKIGLASGVYDDKIKNDDKTELIVIGSSTNLRKVVAEHIVVGEHKIPISAHVKNIGAMFDSSATMKVQVTKIVQTAWYHLYSINKIRPLPVPA